jgi:hypothetical protein
MPRYTMPNGVVVETSERVAANIMGLSPVGSSSSPAKKAPAKAPAKKAAPARK